MFRSTERTHGERGAHAASAPPSIRAPTLHARRALSRALRVFRRAHHVDMSRVHRRAGIAEHRRRTADKVRTEQTRESSGGGAVVRPAPEPPASVPQPHPAHVCGTARSCMRRNRRCWWLALLLGGGLARSRDYECSLHLETMVTSAMQALGTATGTAGARPAGGSSDILVPPPAFEERWGRRDQELSVLKCWWEICEACGKIRYLRGLELRRESAGALLIRAFTPRSTDPLLHTLNQDNKPPQFDDARFRIGLSG